MTKKNKKAFTLVELLVVIAILAILATVSIVGYTGFTAKAKKSVAEQEMTQVKTLLLADWLDGFVGDVNDKITIVKDDDCYKVYSNSVDILYEIFGDEGDENYEYGTNVKFYGDAYNETNKYFTIKSVEYLQGNGYIAVWTIDGDTLGTKEGTTATTGYLPDAE